MDHSVILANWLVDIFRLVDLRYLVLGSGNTVEE